MMHCCQEDEAQEAQEKGQGWRWKYEKEIALLKLSPLEKLSPREPLKKGLIRASSPKELISILHKLHHLTYWAISCFSAMIVLQLKHWDKALGNRWLKKTKNQSEKLNRRMVKGLSKTLLVTKVWEDFAIYVINRPLLMLPAEHLR